MCHSKLSEWIGKQTKLGIITNAYTMLDPLNDVFVINNRKYRREEILSILEEVDPIPPPST